MYMIKALWFAMKFGAVVALAVWISSYEGQIDVHWQGYDIQISTNFALLVGLFALILLLSVHRFYLFMLNIPAFFRRKRERKKLSKGLKAVTYGLTAMATGDVKHLSYQAHRAASLLGDEHKDLPLILRSYGALENGEYYAAREGFEELMQSKDTLLIGLRGLLMQAFKHQNYDQARGHIDKALRSYPKEAWLVFTAYQLQIIQHDWDSCLKTVRLISKIKNVHIPTDILQKEKTAIMTAYADDLLLEGDKPKAVKMLRKAIKLRPDFVPAVSRLVPLLLEEKQRRAALYVIREAWKRNPHRDLPPLWGLIAPSLKPTDTVKRLRWFEKLIALQPENEEAYLAAAQAAIEDGLWGEARGFCDKAESIRKSARVYRLRAQVAQSEGNMKLAADCLQQASRSDHGQVWVCAKTGRLYDGWMPVAKPHGSFNTIIWDYPENARSDQSSHPVSIMQIAEQGSQSPIFGSILPAAAAPVISQQDAVKTIIH